MKSRMFSVRFETILALLLLFANAAVVAQAPNNRGKTNDTVSSVYRELLQRSVLEERLLPVFKEGKVSAVENKAGKLLEYIIEDYISQDLTRARAIHYSTVAGLRDIQNAASGIGQFKATSKPTASYFMTIGGEIATAELAVVLIAIERADGIYETESVAYWDKQSAKWRLLRSAGPSTSPLGVEALK